MTAKEYLGQAYRLDQRINSKLEQIRSLNELAAKCTSTITGMPKAPSHSTSMMEEAVGKIVDLQTEIDGDIGQLVDLKRDMVSIIKPKSIWNGCKNTRKRFEYFKRLR